MPDEEAGPWTTREIIRELKRQTASFEKFAAKMENNFAGLDSKFVGRSEFDRSERELLHRIDAIAGEVTDLDADWTRYRKERSAEEKASISAQATKSSSTWQFWAGQAVSAVLGAALAVVVLLVVAGLAGITKS